MSYKYQKNRRNAYSKSNGHRKSNKDYKRRYDNRYQSHDKNRYADKTYGMKSSRKHEKRDAFYATLSCLISIGVALFWIGLSWDCQKLFIVGLISIIFAGVTTICSFVKALKYRK